MRDSRGGSLLFSLEGARTAGLYLGMEGKRGHAGPKGRSVRRERNVLDAPWEDLLACYLSLRRELGRVLEDHGMLLSDYRALRVLEDRPATLGEVARRLGLAPATLTTLARGLERRGWTDRVRSPKDGRAFVLKVTPRGLRALREARRSYRIRLQTLEGFLPAGSRESVARALSELRRGLEQAEERAARVGPPRD